jgi:hypothetical protein
MDVLQIAAGISTAFGLLAFVAALYFRNLATVSERNIRGTIAGEVPYSALDGILSRFSTDADRLKALELLLGHDTARADAFLKKIKDKIDPLRLAAMDARRYFALLITGALTLIALAILAFWYSTHSPVQNVTSQLPSPTALTAAPLAKEADIRNYAQTGKVPTALLQPSAEITWAPGEAGASAEIRAVAAGQPAILSVSAPAEAGKANFLNLSQGETYTFHLQYSKDGKKSQETISSPIIMPVFRKELSKANIENSLEKILYTGPIDAAGNAESTYGVIEYYQSDSSAVTYAGNVRTNRPDGTGTITAGLSSCTGAVRSFDVVAAECRLRALKVRVKTPLVFSTRQYLADVIYLGGVTASTDQPNVELGPFRLVFAGRGELTATEDGAAHRYDGRWEAGVLREGQMDLGSASGTGHRFQGTFAVDASMLTGHDLYAVNDRNIQVIPYTNGAARIGNGAHAFSYEIDAGRLDDGDAPVRGLSVWSYPSPRLRVFDDGHTTIEINHNSNDEVPRLCKPTRTAPVDTSPWDLRCSSGPDGYCIVENRKVGVKFDITWPRRSTNGRSVSSPKITLAMQGNDVNPSSISIDDRVVAVPATNRMTQPEAYGILADLCAGHNAKSPINGEAVSLDKFCVAAAFALARAINCPDSTFFGP